MIHTITDISDLITQIGCDSLEPLARDVSPREYFHGSKSGKKFVLMFYPEANEKNRAEMLEFIRIGQWLEGNGLKSPYLYEVNNEKCYALFEDLGRTSFGSALKNNKYKQEFLYIIASDVLKIFCAAQCLGNLPKYANSRIHKNKRQIIDFYVPLKQKEFAHRDMVNDYLLAWDEIENDLPPCPHGFVHADFHLENMLLLADGDGVGQCALIDYQDALYGPLPYDLVNLLEDARIDVPEKLRSNIINHYCKGMSQEEKVLFLKWYRVLGTQFHCRVIGLFIMLAAKQGRDDYLIHINRLQNYIKTALKDPLLTPLRLFFEKEGLDFEPIIDLNGPEVRSIFKLCSKQAT